MLYGDFELFWSRNLELKKQNSSLLDDKRHLHTQLISVKSELQDVASELKQSKLLLEDLQQQNKSLTKELLDLNDKFENYKEIHLRKMKEKSDIIGCLEEKYEKQIAQLKEKVAKKAKLLAESRKGNKDKEEKLQLIEEQIEELR